ncbi:MarC family protein [Actinoplanes sp. NBC_00393]|uniref:MarC family protein n=1 Tax=Actinoplanes sp. NBC_00393 TaxID=2975953 RepID=UPI002E20BB36
MSFKYEALVLFLALFALYSPVAALSSYLPIVRPFTHPQQLRLALGLALNVTVFVLLAIWVGEPLLELLGISTAALTATGGIALILASVPLMRGTGGVVPDAPAASVSPAAAAAAQPGAAVAPTATPITGTVPASSADSVPAASAGAVTSSSGPAPSGAGPVPAGSGSSVSSAVPAEVGGPTDPRSVLFTPITFPLTVGGTTFAFGVAASADAGSVSGRLWLSVAAVAYAIVTGVTLYLSGHVERRISPAAAAVLDRVAGILLTSIAVVLLANGFTDLVYAAWGTG